MTERSNKLAFVSKVVDVCSPLWQEFVECSGDLGYVVEKLCQGERISPFSSSFTDF